jgi:DNA-binding MarR family transcriptional regulator
MTTVGQIAPRPRTSPLDDESVIDAVLEGGKAAFHLFRTVQAIVAMAIRESGLRDLNAVHGWVLLTIARLPLAEANITQIEQVIGSSARQSVKILVDRGYLDARPSPHDRRRVALVPTTRGNKAVSAIGTALAEAARDRIGEESLAASWLQLPSSLEGVRKTIRGTLIG